MNTITRTLVIATIFLVPTYLIRFNIFGIPTNILELLIYATFISFALGKPHINWKEFYEKYKPYILLAILILLGLLSSTIANQKYRDGLGIIKGWFFDPLLFSFVLLHIVRTRKDIEIILKSFYFSACVVSLIAFEYFLYGQVTYDGRLKTFYLSPNYLAMFLAPSVFIGFYLLKPIGLNIIQWSQLKLKNIIVLLSMVAIIFSLYKTYSYAAWIAILFGLMAMSYSVKIITRKTVLFAVIAAFLLAITQIHNPKLTDFFSERSSLQSRLTIWKSSALMLEHNPIFGIGPGNFQNTYLAYQKYFPPYLEWAVPEPHNLYLAFWLQSGIMGLIGFIAIVFVWFRRTVIFFAKNEKNSSLSAVLAGIIIYMLIHGLTDTTYWKNDLSLLFWICISIGIRLSEINAVELSVGSVDKKEDVAIR